MIAAGVGELVGVVGTRGACAALAVPRASHYRHLRGPRHGPPISLTLISLTLDVVDGEAELRVPARGMAGRPEE